MSADEMCNEIIVANKFHFVSVLYVIANVL